MEGTESEDYKSETHLEMDRKGGGTKGLARLPHLIKVK